MNGNLDIVGQLKEDLGKREFLTVRELCEVLGLSKPVVYAAIKSGEIPSITVGGKSGKTLIHVDVLERMRLQAGAAPHKEESKNK